MLLVSSVNRVAESQSKCGTVARLTTTQGVATLDDDQLCLDKDIWEYAQKIGINVDNITMMPRGPNYGDCLLNTKVNGLFNFIDNHERKCDQVQPVSDKLVINFRSQRTLQYGCGIEKGSIMKDACKSSYSYATGDHKAGVKYLAFEKVYKMEVPEIVVSHDDISIKVVQNPNHPLVQRVEIFDHATMTKVNYRLMLGKRYDCTSRTFTADEDETRGDTHVLKFSGTVHEGSQTYRKYIMIPRNTTTGIHPSTGKPAVHDPHAPERRQVVAWFVQKGSEWVKHKVVPPGESAATLIFDSFEETNDVSVLLGSLPESIHRPPLGHGGYATLGDLPKTCQGAEPAGSAGSPPKFTSAFTEDPEKIEFYVAKLAAVIEQTPPVLNLEHVPQYYGVYWHDQVANYFYREESEGWITNTTNGSNGSRRLTEEPVEKETSRVGDDSEGGEEFRTDDEETHALRMAGNNTEAMARRLGLITGWEFRTPDGSLRIGMKKDDLCDTVYASGEVGLWKVEGGIQACKSTHSTDVSGYLKITFGKSKDFGTLIPPCDQCGCLASAGVGASALVQLGHWNTPNRRRSTAGESHRRRAGRFAMKLSPSLHGGGQIAHCWGQGIVEGALSLTVDPIGPCWTDNSWTSWDAEFSVELCGVAGWLRVCYSGTFPLGSGWSGNGRRRCSRRRRFAYPTPRRRRASYRRRFWR